MSGNRRRMCPPGKCVHSNFAYHTIIIIYYILRIDTNQVIEDVATYQKLLSRLFSWIFIDAHTVVNP